jgi:hypothetical protein
MVTMWRIARLVLIALFAVLAVAPATEAAAVALPAGHAVAGTLAQGAQPPAPTEPVVPPVTSAPPGLQLDPAETEADAERSRSKLVVGIIAAVLLGIVILGRRARTKTKGS